MSRYRGPSGALETPEALRAGDAVATLLGSHLGRWEEAKPLMKELVAASEKLENHHLSTLALRSQLAGAMERTGQMLEARELYEEVLEQQLGVLGPESRSVLSTQGNLATLLGSLRQNSSSTTRCWPSRRSSMGRRRSRH
eukprot:SAG22_NODE_339_length_12034_cov_3.087474_7_plen_140_part_00